MTRDFAWYDQEGRLQGHASAIEMLGQLNAAKLEQLNVRLFARDLHEKMKDAERELESSGCSIEKIRIFSNAWGTAVCTAFNEFRQGVAASASASTRN